MFAIIVGQAGLLIGLKKPAMFGLLFCWIMTIFSFVGYRMVLNLNQLRPINDESTSIIELTTGMGILKGGTTTNVGEGSCVCSGTGTGTACMASERLDLGMSSSGTGGVETRTQEHI